MDQPVEIRAWRDMRSGMSINLIARVAPFAIGGVEQRLYLTCDGPPVEVERHHSAPIFGLLGDGEAQRLANDLWDAGIRPQQAQQGQGAMEAVGAHLADMRALVAARYDLELP